MQNERYEAIRRAFPGIDGIERTDLREGVARVWTRALRDGNFETPDDIPFSAELPDCSLPTHVNWVLGAALGLADLLETRAGPAIDRDLLIAAVLLHDVGKAFEYERKGSQPVKSEIGDASMK